MSALQRFVIRLSFHPTLWYSRALCALGVWHRWDWVDEHVLLGSAPSRSDIARLRGLGIGAVVNMCAEFAGHEREMAACGMTQLRLPTLDYHTPSESDLIRGVHFMGEQVSSGGKVYVHCKAGRGRSSMMVLCHLIASRKISAKQAFDVIQKARPHVNKRLDQRPVVQSIERMVAEGTLPSG